MLRVSSPTTTAIRMTSMATASSAMIGSSAAIGDPGKERAVLHRQNSDELRNRFAARDQRIGANQHAGEPDRQIHPDHGVA